MARLSLSLLGTFRVTLDGLPVTAFKSNKVRALLAYLAVEAHRPHRREVLAGLLWPDWPDRDALNNLRYSLSNLKQALGGRTVVPASLLVSHDELQFNPASDYVLDVKRLVEAAGAIKNATASSDTLEQVVDLCHDPFLDGFSLGDCPEFEQWLLWTRERLARDASAVLRHLAETYEQHGDYDRAQAYAWRQLEHEPWDERVHQVLMRSLALSDQRAAALAQYQSCRQLLAEELAVEPSAETTRLYEQIRDGLLKPSPAHALRQGPTTKLPPFLQVERPAFERPLFVARERELAQLHGFLDQALASGGKVIFVTGEVGSGKTALLHEFIRRAQAERADLVVASGGCNAYTGIGDPYLPFREILRLLAGDVEARWAAGAMTQDHATRLWNTFPTVAQTLVETGPDLLDTFVPSLALLDRAKTGSPGQDEWQARLRDLVESRPVQPGAPGLLQQDLFDQYTRVVLALSRHAPVLLVVDDLQWADAGSISLLFHIGRHLNGSRVLVVGAYRPEEVAIGRQGSRHLLEPVANELQRDFGDIAVNLGPTDSREFVEAVLDSEPNSLGPDFRDMLYRQTRGHPLFTVELLRGLQARGDVVQDASGQWAEGPNLDWESMPARVEAVVGERIGRLGESLQAVMRAASVEGEVFTAEVIARVTASDEREVLRLLSDELDRRHRLIRADSIQRTNGQLQSRYRFRHILFQKYLYSSLDDVERVHLHERVGTALEELYAPQAQATAMAVQLAMHFDKAGITGKTVGYLHMAGDEALRLSAYQEARALLKRGLQLLMTQPDSPERAQKELGLQLSLGIAWMGDIPRPEWENAITRARTLCQQTGRMRDLCETVGQLSIYHYVRGEYRKATEFGAEGLSLAEQVGDPLDIAVSHWHLGFILFGAGEFIQAREHLSQTLAFYEPQQHHRAMVALRGTDAGVGALAYDAACLWCLGYAEQAVKRSRQALTLARTLGHALSSADALCYAGCLFNTLARDASALQESAAELARISDQMEFSSFGATAIAYEGIGLARLESVPEGIARIRRGLERVESTGTVCQTTLLLGSLAEALAKAGQWSEALQTFDEALALALGAGERYYEAEIHRLRAELLLALGDRAGAEAGLRRAIKVARRQRARMWELRAATSLGRVLHEQGRDVEARAILARSHGWFTEGFDTAELRAAAAALAELP